ncbi:Peptidoglycan/LPS O-acetylase OafA/YrhL, contains acyltransferase and SGNH-hydrolase domains [Amycolatopsis xylanica]|uniref:Peptidoglycan/LPS O-acetylase OafA/YrhL, contains acyltransferase and SGNH-hydrolase domains n=1 Tax=Amycolatopsis xylanica TaxID=589385 RepID=A0A1H2U3J0_9PSEU|nr:acyltransferase [Amycolatopsis xylanica]SDW50773.1 Peptidoglycan/LPS O-acetylase OafA/YrhL, contains acyltransferase and SGNH-hydrolase domains [Amycolatopsis xylanica]
MPMSYAEYLATRHFHGLTGVRALAAVAVVFFHYGGPALGPLQGWIAVHLFFVLSGFLITTLSLREEDRSGRVSLRAFWVRRVFRIMPVYYTVLALTAVFVVIGGQYWSSRLGDAMPLYLVFGNELVDYNTPLGMSWTLGVEEKFYFVWPALLVLTALAKSRKLWLRTGICVLSVAAVVFVVLPLTNGEGMGKLAAHYVSLVIGCLLALLMHHPKGFALVRPLMRPVVAVPVALGFCVFQLFVGDLVPLVGGIPWFTPIYALVSSLLLVAVVAPGPVQRLLACRPLKYIGDRSYGLYLSQVMAAAVTGVIAPPGWGKAIATAAVALGIACVLYRWVEMPMITRGRQLAAKLPQASPVKARTAASEVVSVPAGSNRPKHSRPR